MTGSVVPSYIQKLGRAQKHLVELDGAIKAWADSHPYEVRSGREGKRCVRRLFFTTWPENTDIPIVAADVIYNFRSALDHIMCALVPSARRSRVYFPILWEGVWGADVPGEDKERINDRHRWLQYTQGAASGAVAILQKLQPPDDGGKSANSTVHALRVLNILANKDRHTRLPVTVPGLQYVTLAWQTRGGADFEALPAADAWSDTTMVKHGAEVDPSIPHDAVHVDVNGTPLVAVHVAQEESDVPLVYFLRSVVSVTQNIIGDLAPFVR